MLKSQIAGPGRRLGRRFTKKSSSATGSGGLSNKSCVKMSKRCQKSNSWTREEVHKKIIN